MKKEELKQAKDSCILRDFRTKEVRVWVTPPDATLVTSYIKEYKEKDWVLDEEDEGCWAHWNWKELVKVYYWMSHFIHVPKYSEPWISEEARGLDW